MWADWHIPNKHAGQKAVKANKVCNSQSVKTNNQNFCEGVSCIWWQCSVNWFNAVLKNAQGSDSWWRSDDTRKIAMKFKKYVGRCTRWVPTEEKYCASERQRKWTDWRLILFWLPAWQWSKMTEYDDCSLTTADRLDGFPDGEDNEMRLTKA